MGSIVLAEKSVLDHDEFDPKYLRIKGVGMLNDKKYVKIEKTLGKDTIAQLEGFDQSALSDRVVQAEQAIKGAVDELEANPEYQSMKEALNDLKQGMREVRKRQNAVIAYCLHLLEEKGQP